MGRIGYDLALYASVPEESITSFAETGNPFSLGPINDGYVVVDVGSGSGFDAFVASQLVGPKGWLVVIDMTSEMLFKARSGAKVMGAENVEFRVGYADQLPLPDNFADVLISNGVLNLTLNKEKTHRDCARMLKSLMGLYRRHSGIEKDTARVESLHPSRHFGLGLRCWPRIARLLS